MARPHVWLALLSSLLLPCSGCTKASEGEGSCDGYITYYSGQVVAVLDGDRGTKMRCHFILDERDEGVTGGGWGECQVSNGDRITAMFDRSDASRVYPS